MNYSFSKRISSLQPSAIREILKFTSDPQVIPFAAGNPAPDAFPVCEVQKITNEILNSTPVDALQYGVTEGYEPLRNKISKMMKTKYNAFKEFDEILITSGAQQVVDLTAKILLNEGDTVICEEPSFIGSLNCFRSYKANLCGVSVDSDGINIENLEKALKTEKNVKLIYTIPNFQNPSGSTMPLKKRKAVYDLAKKYGVLILEDNPYGELRVIGDDVPPIKSLDEDGLVIYAGSFSKLLSPGIRVGYVIAPKQLISKMTVGKQCADVHTPVLTQMIVDKWLQNYNIDEHISKIQDIYRKKLNLMCDMLDKELGSFVEYVKPEGGLFIWCKLPDNVDMLEFVKVAVENKVAVVPGTAFLTDESKPCQYFRVNFSTPSDECIVKGMKILGEVSKKYK